MEDKYRVKIIIVNETRSSEHIVYNEQFIGLLIAHHLARVVKHAFELVLLTQSKE